MTLLHIPATRIRSIHHSVVDELGRRIVAGEVAPGEGLPAEPELARQLDVSRTVVREALRVLAAKGLVVARPMRGTRVRPAKDWQVMDADVLGWRVAAVGEPVVLRELLEVRAIVEPPAARRAADRSGATPALTHALGAMEAAVHDGPRFVEADLAFHAAILEATGNATLGQLYAVIGAALRLGREAQLRGAQGAGRSGADALPGHALVRDAIAARDGDAAETAMRAVVDGAAADAEAALAAPGSPPRG